MIGGSVGFGIGFGGLFVVEAVDMFEEVARQYGRQ